LSRQCWEILCPEFVRSKAAEEVSENYAVNITKNKTNPGCMLTQRPYRGLPPRLRIEQVYIGSSGVGPIIDGLKINFYYYIQRNVTEGRGEPRQLTSLY
jgi:hypothetical protein